MTAREPGVYRQGKRHDTPHGPGYRLVRVRTDGTVVESGWAVQGGLDGKRWTTRDVDGQLVVSAAYRDSSSLSSVLLEHDHSTRPPVPWVSTAQRYTDPAAHDRMAKGTCPECGCAPEAHAGEASLGVALFAPCSLLARGVADRIAQYRADVAASSS